MDFNATTSRRHLAQVAVAGLAAAVAAPALAQTNAPPESHTVPPQKLADLRTLYTRPPFQPQSQPWPALAGKMHPKPDSGETSYVGTGRLAGRKAVPVPLPGDIRNENFCKKLVADASTTPMGRPGEPVELAPIYVLLASNEASYITGQVYGANGGMGQP